MPGWQCHSAASQSIAKVLTIPRLKTLWSMEALPCCKFWIYRMAVNTKFQLIQNITHDSITDWLIYLHMTQGIGCPYPRPYSRNNSELWRHHTTGGQYWHCEFDKNTQPRRSWFGSLYNARAEIWQSSRSHPFPRESRTCEPSRQFSFRDQELWSIRIHRDSHPDSAGIRDSLWLRILLGVFVLSPCMFRVPQNLKKKWGKLFSVWN